MKKIFYLIGIIALGCSSSDMNNEIISEEVPKNSVDTSAIFSVNTQKRTADKIEFNTFYKEFVITILDKSAVKLNTFIHKDYGLHFIEAPGAMPMFVKVYNIENFRDINAQTPFFELAFNEMDKTPINESLPQLICDDNIYDKQGCFVQEANPLNNTQIWNYSDLTDKQKQEIEVIAGTVTNTVVNTSNYTFYFSLINNNWFITFIDIRTPCSA